MLQLRSNTGWTDFGVDRYRTPGQQPDRQVEHPRRHQGGSSSTNPGDPTHNTLAPGLRGWATHIQNTKVGSGPQTYAVTETALADWNLSATENGDLENLFLRYPLGSGRDTAPTHRKMPTFSLPT